MTTATSPADERRIVQLLTVVVALLGVLVVGLGAASALAWREIAGLRQASAALRDRAPSAGDALTEIATRQDAAARQLAALVRDAERQMAQFQRRADELRSREGGGPMVVAARAVELMQLMTDQMNLALKQATAMQDVLAKGVRPLGAEEQVANPSGTPESTGDRGQRAGRKTATGQRDRDAGRSDLPRGGH